MARWLKMMILLPLWYHISDAARVALYRYQLEIYGLKLDIPEYPSSIGHYDYEQEMRKPPHKPVRIS